jgi:hypothetical protein
LVSRHGTLDWWRVGWLVTGSTYLVSGECTYIYIYLSIYLYHIYICLYASIIHLYYRFYLSIHYSVRMYTVHAQWYMWIKTIYSTLLSSRATYLISGISHTKHEAKNWSNHPRLDSVTHKK